MQTAIANQEFKVQINAIRRLDALADDRHLNYALDRLNRILDDTGISDNQTVEEYVVARILPAVRDKINLPESETSCPTNCFC